MNDWWDYIAHAQKAQEREGHKYVARVEVGTKNGHTLYRYFYSNEEYEAYRNGRKEGLLGGLKQKAHELVTKIRNKSKKAVSDVKSFVQKILNKEPKKEQVDKGRKFVEEHLPDDKPKEILHKYIAKVDLGNGRYRYFYLQDDYDRYLARLKYRENEPDFMKDIPKIDITAPDTKDTDQKDINEDYDPFVEARSENCFYCTTAYELRQRGYDVQAAECNPFTYNCTLFTPERYYEGADVELVNADGSLTDMNPLTDQGFKRRRDGSMATAAEAKEAEDKIYKEQKYWANPKAVRDTIVEYSTKGSRGNLMVYWKGGGGHSMAYEVDKHGNLTIRDCQTNECYDYSFIFSNSANVLFVRTDNLKLKKDILEAVEAN